MPKVGPTTNLDEYAPVADRIALFYRRFPFGRIITRLVKQSSDAIVVQAAVYRSTSESRPAATGLAAERPGDGEVNTVACLENTETSAIGRALANLGLGAVRPRLRDGVQRGDDAFAALESLGVRTIFSRPKISHHPFVPASIQAPHPSGNDVPDPPRDLSLVARDLIRLLDDAERYGMRPRRAGEYRRRIASDRCSDTQLEPLERALRNWLRSARERSLADPAQRDGPT